MRRPEEDTQKTINKILSLPEIELKDVKSLAGATISIPRLDQLLRRVKLPPHFERIYSRQALGGGHPFALHELWDGLTSVGFTGAYLGEETAQIHTEPQTWRLASTIPVAGMCVVPSHHHEEGISYIHRGVTQTTSDVEAVVTTYTNSLTGGEKRGREGWTQLMNIWQTFAQALSTDSEFSRFKHIFRTLNSPDKRGEQGHLKTYEYAGLVQGYFQYKQAGTELSENLTRLFAKLIPKRAVLPSYDSHTDFSAVGDMTATITMLYPHIFADQWATLESTFNPYELRQAANNVRKVGESGVRQYLMKDMEQGLLLPHLHNGHVAAWKLYDEKGPQAFFSHCKKSGLSDEEIQQLMRVVHLPAMHLGTTPRLAMRKLLQEPQDRLRWLSDTAQELSPVLRVTKFPRSTYPAKRAQLIKRAVEKLHTRGDELAEKLVDRYFGTPSPSSTEDVGLDSGELNSLFGCFDRILFDGATLHEAVEVPTGSNTTREAPDIVSTAERLHSLSLSHPRLREIMPPSYGKVMDFAQKAVALSQSIPVDGNFLKALGRETSFEVTTVQVEARLMNLVLEIAEQIAGTIPESRRRDVKEVGSLITLLGYLRTDELLTEALNEFVRKQPSRGATIYNSQSPTEPPEES